MGALLGERGGAGSFASGPEGYETKALGMGSSPHGGSVGQPGVGSSTGDFEIWLKGALGVESLSLSLCGSSVKGTWRYFRTSVRVLQFRSAWRRHTLCTGNKWAISLLNARDWYF